MNVEDLLVQKQVPFIPKGADFVVSCLNPEHADKNPSMRIDRITGIFNCFSCEYKGNLFTYFGEKPNHLQLQREKLKNLIRQKMAESSGLVFPFNKEDYKGNWRGIRQETYTKFEAFTHVDKEFISRINFPIRDITGKIVAFNGRHTSSGIPKYLITPAGAQMPLYPMVQPIGGCVVLVEGIFDMLNLHDKGMTNAICCFGTKNIDEKKLSVLKIQGVSQIDIFFDGDDAGQNASTILRELAEEVGLSVRNVHMKNTDPGDLTETQVVKLRNKLYA
jgi:DNA primase